MKSLIMEYRYISLCQHAPVNFGHIVKSKRVSLDWSKERLGLEIHRCRKTIHAIENGQRVCNRTIGQVFRLWPDLYEEPGSP